MSILLRVLLGLALIAAACRPAWPQRLLVHTYTEQEGLPVSEAFDVAQDPEGRIWCATRVGVVAYDGTTWEFVRDWRGELIRDAQVLRFDSRGRPWIFKRNGSVLRGTEDGPEGLRGNPALLDRNTMLLGAALLEGPQGEALLLGDYDDGLFRWDGEAWADLGAALDPHLERLLALEAHAGTFYVGGSGGLVSLAPDASSATPVAMPPGVDPTVRGLLAERTGVERLWVLGRGWIGTLGRDAVELLAAPLPALLDSYDPGLALVADGQGGLYFADALNVFHFDAASGSVQRLGRANGLVAEGARGLHVDEEGLLWIATPLGLSKLVGRHWETYGTAEGMLRGETSALVELDDGRLVLGHNGGLSFLVEGHLEPLAFEHDLPQGPGRARVLDLDSDAQGNLWIAASELGLGRLDAEGALEWIPVPEVRSHWATAVHCGRDGEVWLGTSKGLMRLQGGQLRRVADRTIGTDYIRCLAEGPEGRLLVGGQKGVWAATDDGWTLAQVEALRPAIGVFALLVDRSGTTWVGARTGLLRLESGVLEPARIGLPADRAVYTLLEDGEGRLWIGTDFGIYRLEGEHLEHLTVRDGLSGNETNRAAGLVDRRGDVWIGTEKGLSRFRPGLERTFPPPEVGLLPFGPVGESSVQADDLRVAAGPNELRFRARARTLVDEHGLAWRARLEGHEDTWRELHARTVLEVRYANLPPGSYRFHVQARRGDGDWGPVASSVAIHVGAPLWRQTWFRALALLCIAGLGAGLYRFVTQGRLARDLEREVRRRSEELAASQRELARTERLRSLGVLAGGIAHDFNNVLTALTGSLSLLRLRLQGRADAAPLLDASDKALERARQLSSQLLTFAKGGEPQPRPLRLRELVDDTLALVLSGSVVRSEVDLADDLWPILADPAQICQALENLLINARQSMPGGGTVHLRARNVSVDPARGGLRPGRYVRLDVRDEGPGIPAEVLPHVFEPFFTTKEGGSGLGLATARSVFERHGGMLTVASQPGSGATFSLHVPAADVPGAGPTEEPASALPASAHGGLVLVMDDEPVVRSLLGEILRALGYEARETASGEEALQALAALRADGRRVRCAILDLTVPGGMGGREALPRLRELEPDLPAIATSGYAEDAILARPTEHGFQAALAKPFRVQDVASALGALDP